VALCSPNDRDRFVEALEALEAIQLNAPFPRIRLSHMSFIKPRVNMKFTESSPVLATLPLTKALAKQNRTHMYQVRILKTAVPSREKYWSHD